MFESIQALNLHSYHPCVNQLKDFIYRIQEQKFAAGAAKRDAIDSVTAFEAYNAEMREKFIDCLGGIPEPADSLNAQTVRRYTGDGFTVDAVRFTSRPGVWVTGSLYLPKGITGPRPAVLYVCGHTNEGRLNEQYESVCQVLVKAGLVVLSIDPTGQGERSNFYDPATQERYVQIGSTDHTTCGARGIPAGLCLMRYFISDTCRAVDYMLTRPEIDPAKIGITGHSGGGLQAVAAMVCDDRLAAAAPGTFITTREAIMRSGKPQDSEQVWPDTIDFGFDHVNTILCFAPKPVLLLPVKWDFFPIEGTYEAYEIAKRFYGLYGKEENIRIFADAHIHNYTPNMASAAAEFFLEVFTGEKKSVPAESFPLLPEAEMLAAPEGNVLAIPGSVPIQAEIRAHAAALREARLALPEAERKNRARKWLTAAVEKDRIPSPFWLRTYPPEEYTHDGDYVGIPMCWRSQKQLFAYATAIRRKEYIGQKMPTVIAIWPEGTNQITAHADWIGQQCDAGKQVLVLDAPGVGKLEQDYIDYYSRDYKERYASVYTLTDNLIFGGDSMAAMLIYNALRAIDMLCGEFGLSEEEITLYCDGHDGVIGVMAGFLREKVTVEAGETLLRSIEEEILIPDLYEYRNHHCLVLPGMLEYFDYNELL